MPPLASFPATRLRAYSGGTWRVQDEHTVVNEGGHLIWDHSISPVSFTGSETELGHFDVHAFTPPAPPP